MAEVSFRTSSGGDPVQYIVALAGSVKPTLGDVLYAAQRQRTRIVDRTYRGVDVNGNAFEPYDTTRPYYYYPNGAVGRTPGDARRNKAAVRRILKRTTEVSGYKWEHLMNTGRESEAEKSSVGGTKTRSGQGIRFESYADFKESIGRAGVDLTGLRAPHMLQAIEVRVGGASFGTSDVGSASREPVTEFALGIYGDAVGRATGHNTGVNPRWKREHKRYFFGASVDDLKLMAADIYARISARLKGNR